MKSISYAWIHVIAYTKAAAIPIPYSMGEQASEQRGRQDSEEPRPFGRGSLSVCRGSDEIILPHIAPRCGEACHPVHDHGRDDGEGIN